MHRGKKMKRLLVLAASVPMLALGALTAVAAENYRDIGVNAKLEAMGSKLRLSHAEFSVSREGSFDTVRTVFFKNTGNKQLGHHWAADENLAGFPSTSIFYVTDTVDGAANDGMGGSIDANVTTSQIDAGMAAWDAIGCATLPIVNGGAVPLDLGLVEDLVGGFGSSGLTLVGGVTHGGWLPWEFFEIIGGPGGGNGILGVTFTFIWTDDDGNPLDSNSDGKIDTALREIYMNNNFAWEIGNAQGTGVFDIVAVMNHEQGHALSQGHFGSIIRNGAGKLVWTPKDGDNVMLAAISSNQLFEGFQGSDIGGHCSIWADWPLK